MKFYADRPTVAARQFFVDLFILAWVICWICLAIKVYNLVEKLAVVGQKLTGAGNGMAGGLSSAGDTVDKVPGVGDTLAAPLNQAATAAQSLAAAGTDQQHAVHSIAITMALLLLVVPLGLVLLIWLPLRVRWIRRAGLAVRLRRVRGGRDLLALRALTGQPLGRLIAIHPDPAAAWRAGDQSTVEALAELELRTLGLLG